MNEMNSKIVLKKRFSLRFPALISFSQFCTYKLARNQINKRKRTPSARSCMQFSPGVVTLSAAALQFMDVAVHRQTS